MSDELVLLSPVEIEKMKLNGGGGGGGDNILLVREVFVGNIIDLINNILDINNDINSQITSLKIVSPTDIHLSISRVTWTLNPYNITFTTIDNYTIIPANTEMSTIQVNNYELAPTLQGVQLTFWNKGKIFTLNLIKSGASLVIQSDIMFGVAGNPAGNNLIIDCSAQGLNLVEGNYALNNSTITLEYIKREV